MKIPKPEKPKKEANKKKKLRKEADFYWKEIILRNAKGICIVCGKPAQQAHHFFPKSGYGLLRYEIDNGISLCKGCHFAHHTKGDPKIAEIIQLVKGNVWKKSLFEKARIRIDSYETISWYENNITNLKEILCKTPSNTN